MNDASEVLAVIFECLHRSFTLGSSVSDNESVESNCMGSWDCTNTACMVHSFFGMNISERMYCYNCGLESRHLKYTSFFHNINASALRTTKVSTTGRNFFIPGLLQEIMPLFLMTFSLLLPLRLCVQKAPWMIS